MISGSLVKTCFKCKLSANKENDFNKDSQELIEFQNKSDEDFEFRQVYI